MTRVAPTHSPEPPPSPADRRPPGTLGTAGHPDSDTDPAHSRESAEAVTALDQLRSETGQQLLAELRNHSPADELALATRLRRDHPAALVSAALRQARLRHRATAKFGADAERMYFTDDGLEQATRAPVATWRASRFAALGVPAVADLCCGIGGDALALARAGIRVLAVDQSPLACAVTRANAAELGLANRIEVRQADVTATDISAYDAVFIDPARRSGGTGGSRRTFAPEAYAPPLSWATDVADRVSHAAVKTGPGIPHEAIPDAAEAEWVSDGGAVKEAVLWFGTGHPGRYRATVLPGGHTRVGGNLPAPATGPPARFLYEPDGAVIRAGLVADIAEQVAGRLLDPAIAYVTADAYHPTPYASAYEITDTLAFSVKRLRAVLRERDVGTLTIKKRGFAMTPEELRAKLKPTALRGAQSCTVFLTRIGGAPTMLLGHPLA